VDKKRTVLLFTITYLPIVGGAEMAIHEVTKRMLDFQFVIVTDRIESNLPRREQVGDNVEVVRVGIPGSNIFAKNWYVIAAFFWALRFSMKNNVDIAWAVLESYGAMAASLLKLFIHDVYYVLTLQDGNSELFWKRRIGWWNVLFKRVYHLADHITAISQYLIGRARNVFGYTGPVTLIPNGASESFYKPISSEQKAEIRRRLGIGRHDRVIITTSRLVEKNGIDTLIEAYARVVERGTLNAERTKLVIIGDGMLRKQLESQAARRQLQGSILFTGSLSNETACEYVRAADVFCRPSRSEGQGVSFIEAMASRLVTIGTNVGGIPDFLIDANNGYVVRPDDPDELSRVLEKALEDSETNAFIRERAFVTADEYGWDAIARKYREVFNEVLETISVKKYILFRQFVKYIIVGGLATITDFTTFTALTHAVGLHYVASNVLSVLAGMLVNFKLSRRWTFRAHNKPAAKQFIAYATSTGIYLLMSSGLLLLFVEAFHITRILAKVVTVAIMMMWNFIMARCVVFRYF